MKIPNENVPNNDYHKMRIFQMMTHIMRMFPMMTNKMKMFPMMTISNKYPI